MIDGEQAFSVWSTADPSRRGLARNSSTDARALMRERQVISFLDRHADLAQ
jgi:hypothetical protein